MDDKHYHELCRAVAAPSDGTFQVHPSFIELHKKAKFYYDAIQDYEKMQNKSRAKLAVLNMLKRKFKEL